MAHTTVEKHSSDWWRWIIAVVVALVVMVGVWYALTHLTNIGDAASAPAQEAQETTAESQAVGAELPMDDFTKLALDKAKQGDVEGSLKAFSVAIASNPDGASTPYYYRGLVYVDQGKINEAIDDFTKAIEVDGHFPQAYAARGTAYLMLNRPAKATDDFDRALQLDPKNPITYVNRARAYMGLKMFDEAEADLSRAIDLDPQLLAAYFNRGVLYMTDERPEDALADFNKCVALNPNAPAPYFNRAVAYIELNDKKAAATDLAVYLTISKDEEGKQEARSLLDSLTGTRGENPMPTVDVDSSGTGQNQ